MSIRLWLARMLAVIFLAAFCFQAPASEPSQNIAAPEEHRRGEDQTYLTYPEWFLVFSPAEYARFLAKEPASEFPFFGHIYQFWSSYSAMTEAMGDSYDFNVGYHIMVFVIGTSTTVEYALKSGYEVVFGRWFEVDGEFTPEDELGAFVADDYVDFILSTPWYEYDFFAALGKLWNDVPMTGPHMARKWERRFTLTTEYLVKGAYAILIKAGTQAGYEAPIPETTVLLDRAPPVASDERRVLKQLDDGSVLVTLPRYDAFKDHSSELANSGVNFSEIAGNRGIIIVSLVSNCGKRLSTAGDLLLEQPILTESGQCRSVIRTQIGSLADLLREVTSTGVQLEHVYDF